MIGGYYGAHVCKQKLKFEYGTWRVFLAEIFLAGGGARMRVGVRLSPIAALPAQRAPHASLGAFHDTHAQECLLKCQIIS